MAATKASLRLTSKQNPVAAATLSLFTFNLKRAYCQARYVGTVPT